LTLTANTDKVTLSLIKGDVMSGMIEVNGKRSFVRSRVLAKGCEIEHEACGLLIRKYTDDLNDVGLTDLGSESYKTGGRSGTEFLLDEQQSTFLITLMRNSKQVVKFKKLLTIEFFQQRERLAISSAMQSDIHRIAVRDDGKQIYFQKTDVIKQFVDYATEQGSRSAAKYYCTLAKMENNALFFFEQKYKNLREVLTIKQLMQVSTADDVIEKALKEGMEKEMPYKDIYKLAKERVISFADIIGVSPILQLTQETKT